MSKTKIVEKIVRFELFLTVIGQIFKSDQNKIFPELNSKKHTPSPTVLFLGNCGMRKTWVSQKRNRAILHEMTFANDCANFCIILQNWGAKKEKNFAFRSKKIAQSFAIGNPNVKGD